MVKRLNNKKSIKKVRKKFGCLKNSRTFESSNNNKISNDMKAIINVQDGSVYEICNGKTFEVFKLWSHSVDVIGANPEFPNNGVNFTFNEIIIVDIQDELKSAKLNAKRLGGVHIDIYDHLKKYCKVKKIKAD